jgi:hypothetical protein
MRLCQEPSEQMCWPVLVVRQVAVVVAAGAVADDQAYHGARRLQRILQHEVLEERDAAKTSKNCVYDPIPVLDVNHSPSRLQQSRKTFGPSVCFP